MPLRWKIVGWSTLVLAIVVAALFLVLPVGLRRSLIQAVDQELIARARAVGAVTEIENGSWASDDRAGIDVDFAPGRGLYYVASDRDGDVRLASPLAQSLAVEPITPSERASLPVDQPVVTTRRRGGREFREVVLHVVKSEEDEPEMRGVDLWVRCGKDLAEVRLAVSSLVDELWLLAPIVVLLSLGGGLWLAGRALRPMGRMARTAAAIGEGDRSRRLEVRGHDELSQLARTLNGTFDRLQQAIERQRRFTADASHELRTPLAAVLGHAELALRRSRSPDEYRGALQDTQAAARRMQGVVEGLLVLARADAGALPLQRGPVDLHSLAGEVVRMHQPLAATCEVELAGQGEPVSVYGDAARLAELIGNLVGNAIQHHRSAGHVQVRTSREGDLARLEVIDDGPGIAAEHLPHLFERFYRVDRARSRARGGAGLGLSIARWVAEAHGGRIEVDSEVGRGSRFTVVLPAVAMPDHGTTAERLSMGASS